MPFAFGTVGGPGSLEVCMLQRGFLLLNNTSHSPLQTYPALLNAEHILPGSQTSLSVSLARTKRFRNGNQLPLGK